MQARSAPLIRRLLFVVGRVWCVVVLVVLVVGCLPWWLFVFGVWRSGPVAVARLVSAPSGRYRRRARGVWCAWCVVCVFVPPLAGAGGTAAWGWSHAGIRAYAVFGSPLGGEPAAKRPEGRRTPTRERIRAHGLAFAKSPDTKWYRGFSCV